jgi:TolA-binding protein
MRTHESSRKSLSFKHLAISAAVVVLLAGQAMAQTRAGGDGRALERDLRVGGGGLSPRANFYDEVQLRNAIITGNVGGGKAFRGSVGYTAPGEFRGRLSGASTFAFRRDSTSAGQIRGGDALRFQFNNTTGTGGSRAGYFSNFGNTGRNAATSKPGGNEQITAPRPRIVTDLDNEQLRSGTLRSTATFTSTSSLSPSVVGYQSQGQQRVTASSLLGLRTRDSDEDIKRPGLIESLNTDTLLAQDKSVQRTQAENVLKNQDGRVPDTRTLYDDLRDRLNKGDEQTPRTKPVEPVPAEAVPEAKSEPSREKAEWEKRLDDMRARLLGKDGGLAKSNTDGKTDEAKPTDLDPRTLELIRRAGGQTNQFIDPATGKTDPFAVAMNKGQQLLASGRYFDAEERFANALQIKPGDPTATAARLHSQLGAGLYLSAALNFRQMVQQNPEVTGMKYTGAAIPPVERLTSIAADLRANITNAANAGQTPLTSDGLLLAYVGWQLGEPATIRSGLDVAKRGSAGKGDNQPTIEDNAALVQLLEGVWLADQPKP